MLGCVETIILNKGELQSVVRKSEAEQNEEQRSQEIADDYEVTRS